MKWFIVLLSCFLLACEKDSFKQDPLEGQPDRIRNGDSPDNRKPEPRPACPQQSLIIESVPRVGMFEEGELGTITFSGRVLKCGTDEYEIDVLNLPEGAIYDKQKGVLEYTPPFALVQGSDYYIESYFDLRMKTLSKPVVVKEQRVVYFVRRPGGRKPVVESFKKFPSEIFEGKNTQFEILVKDEDAIRNANGAVKPPRLNFVTTQQDERNALPYLSVYKPQDPIQDFNDKNLWHFVVNLRTEGFENTVNRNLTVKFGVVAISQFGVISDLFEEQFTILNRVKTPYVSWPEVKVIKTELSKGANNLFSFWAVDPFKEGSTRVEFETDCSLLKGKAICKCVYDGNGWSYSLENGSYCTIEWDIPANMIEDRQDIYFKVKNTNLRDSDDYKELHLTRTFFLKKAKVDVEPPNDPLPPDPPPESSNPTPNPPTVEPPPEEPPPEGTKGPTPFNNFNGVNL
ncbi:MAG: hypothetical protein H6625_13900 [Bdellovibrionaceae bacterium]|nr:hypothetical protein [Pseudobdellovibrionaceae bacterium]